MNKRAIIKKIIARLTDELEIYFRAAKFSRAEATHESSKAESKYDTRGLEASHLARGHDEVCCCSPVDKRSETGRCCRKWRRNTWLISSGAG